MLGVVAEARRHHVQMDVQEGIGVYTHPPV